MVKYSYICFKLKTMNCKNCKHWLLPSEDESWGNDDVAFSVWSDEDRWHVRMTEEKQRELHGHATRYCKSPKLLFYERPENGGATVCDGSQYMANLITSENFGCVNFEPI